MFIKFFGLALFLLLLQDSLSESIRQVLFKNGPCKIYQYRCLNKNCISRSLFCDSNDDCGDNSDELYCDTNFRCPVQLSYFRCPSDSSNVNSRKKCIPSDWRCDGIKDCKDNSDEGNCDHKKGKDITAFDLQRASYLAHDWILKERKTHKNTQKWGPDLPRKAVALYLSDKTLFRNNKYADEIAYELSSNFLSKIALKKIEDVMTAEVASYVNAFLVACINPRQFYVLDLVKELRTRLDNMNGTDPFALLAMCNADEFITANDIQKLEDAFWIAHKKNRIDSMVMIILVLSCASSQQKHIVEEGYLSDLVLELNRWQYRNGTVENLKTTALVMQALFATKQESEEQNFDEPEALNQILRSQEADGSFGSFFNTYYVLPVLNGLSLINISSKHCPKLIREEKEGLQRLKDQLGKKLSVKYSLWIGNNKYIQRTLTIRVPLNTSFYGAMEYASDLDMNYRFEYNVRHRKPYIYTLHQLMDNPETNMFWSFNLVEDETSGEVKVIHKSPADFYPKNNDHFVYWYKSEE